MPGLELGGSKVVLSVTWHSPYIFERNHKTANLSATHKFFKYRKFLVSVRLYSAGSLCVTQTSLKQLLQFVRVVHSALPYNGCNAITRKVKENKNKF